MPGWNDTSWHDLSTGGAAAEQAAERAYYFGALLGTMAYGSLLMLFLQLLQVFIARPKRGRTFWPIVAYSWILFSIASFSLGTLWKLCEALFLVNHDHKPSDFRLAYNGLHISTIWNGSAAVFPWIADILMFFRLWTISNHRWWLLLPPAFLYLAKSAVSIPFLILQANPHHPGWESLADAFGTAYFSLTVAFNIYTTIVISILISRMRKRLETVSGKLQALFYTSYTAMFIESGAFFTLWIITYLALRVQHCIFQDVFLPAIIQCLGITRIQIVLRMAQDRAWSWDLVQATNRGVMDWKVSSSQSIQLNDHPSREDSILSISRKMTARSSIS